MAINPTNLPRDTPPGVINPYQNLEVITHKKFISHLGIAFVDLKTVHRQWMRGSKTLLRKVCGQFNYGTLNAILGPWQSGKTTLLKSLAGRNNEEIDHETQFFINGDVPPRAVYLDKDTNTNILLSLTVDECLDFAFRFRNPSWRGGNRAERRATVKELLRNFELKDIQDIELRFCTNEEQIRAQVAMALCTVDKPNMIFIDEPLHDLDAVGIENVSWLFSYFLVGLVKIRKVVCITLPNSCFPRCSLLYCLRRCVASTPSPSSSPSARYWTPTYWRFLISCTCSRAAACACTRAASTTCRCTCARQRWPSARRSRRPWSA